MPPPAPRTGTQVAVESLEIAHEGFRSAKRHTPSETIVIVVEEIKPAAK